MNKIVFLGTGSAMSLTRQLTSIVLVFDKEGIMVDCGDGMGTIRNLFKANIPITSINDIYLTHRHADHLSGISQFLFIKLIKDPDAKVRVFGDKKTLSIARRFIFDTHDFVKDREKQVAFIPISPKKEIEFYHKYRVKAVNIMEKNKHDLICFAYAFMYKRIKIVFSADMAPNRQFEKLTDGADILIHECFGFEKDAIWIHKMGHSTARDTGETAQKSKVKHLILTHLQDELDVPTGKLKSEAQKYYRGKITVAHDLMEISF